MSCLKRAPTTGPFVAYELPEASCQNCAGNILLQERFKGSGARTCSSGIRTLLEELPDYCFGRRPETVGVRTGPEE